MGQPRHSLKRIAPVESTKKNVAIMEVMMVVKLATITICVIVILVHQGVVSLSGVGMLGDRPAGSMKGRLGAEPAAPKGLLLPLPLLLLDGPKGLTGRLSAAAEVTWKATTEGEGASPGAAAATVALSAGLAVSCALAEGSSAN